MKTKLSYLAVFALGAVVGSGATWYLLQDRYEVIETTSTESDDISDVASETISERIELDIPNEDEEKVEEYHEIIETYDYTKHSESNETEKENEYNVDDAPYVIRPEEFGELEEYELVDLVYYADGQLADYDDNLIDDIEETVGFDSLESFGQYEDDVVHVRNDRTQCDYEISVDHRRYIDVVGR